MVLTRTSRTYLTIAILVAVLCSCSSEDGNINDNPNAGTLKDQYSTLLKRPNIEQATQKYKNLLDEAKATLASKFDLPAWEYVYDSQIDESGCGFDFPDVKPDQGVARSISGGLTRGNISSENWNEAVQVVSKIANKYGFRGPERVVDKPGERGYNYYDSAGTRFHIGQGNNITVSISTGCFLTPEAHQRGGPPANPYGD